MSTLPERTKYWYDTEFIDDGRTIDLISLGMLAQDGRELYMQSVHYSGIRASAWVCQHVLPLLKLCPYNSSLSVEQDRRAHAASGRCVPDTRGLCPWRTRIQMKHELGLFMNPATYGPPELWAYYAAYDHICYAQIFGPMVALPDGFPMYTNDLKQWAVQLGDPRLPAQEGVAHNALEDARWNKRVWEFLREREASRAAEA